jgi:chromosome segregation ATPase
MAALRLNELEKGGGKPFTTLAEEYARLKEGVDKFKSKVESLGKNKEELIKEVEPLRSQLELLGRAKNRLENDVEIQTRKLQELPRDGEDSRPAR